MAQTASVTAQKFAQFLTADDAGVNSAIGELSNAAGLTVATIPPAHIFSQNTPVLIAERSLAVKYPVIHVYVDRVRNLLTEKFRSFSGKVRTVAEVRVSQDRIEGLEDQTRLYVEAVTQVLDANRGGWGQGAFFTGAYEVNYEQVQQGGRNFLQIAKVTFEVDLSS